MRSAQFRLVVLGMFVGLLGGSPAGAQEIVSSIGNLKTLGSSAKVTVTDTNGREFRGTIADASDTMLSLQVGHAIRQFAATDVAAVRVRKEDSLANGALIGAAINGGLASLMFLDNECSDDPVCYKAVAVYTGVGALAGLGIDALIHGSRLVYTASTKAGRRVFTVASLVARRRSGVRLAIAF